MSATQTIFSFSMSYQITTRTFSDLKKVLMSPESLGTDEQKQPAYYVCRGPEESGMLGPNITILPPWKVGQELAKTYGHYHVHGEQERYKILMGRALCLMQKLGSDGTNVEEIRAVVASEGCFIQVPSDFGHLIINIGSGPLVAADWEPVSSSHLYDQIKDKRGLAYYIINDSGELTAVSNALYHNVPKLVWEYLDTEDS